MAMQDKHYHIGIRGTVARSTLADANEIRDWCIYGDFVQILIHGTRKLYADTGFGLDLQETVYALDSSIIDLCLSMFPWEVQNPQVCRQIAYFTGLARQYSGFHIDHGDKVHDFNAFDNLVPEPGAIYVMDRAYLDFQRLCHCINVRLYL